MTLQRLLIAHRRHLTALMRSAHREVPVSADLPLSSSFLAASLVDSGSTPSQAMARAEAEAELHKALEQLDALDREVLTLRHFEQVDNAEAAEILEISPAAASQRYYRALKRIRIVLAPIAG